MTAPVAVDVLAVMQAICDRGLSNGRQWYDMPEATSAARELIEAAQEVSEIFEDRRGNEFFDIYQAPFRRLTIALARCGGAQ